MRTFRFRIGEKVFGISFLDNLPSVEEDHTVGDCACEVHLMGHDQHRAAVFCKLQHGVEHLAHHLRIERCRYLVKQHDLRMHTQRSDDRDTLLLTSGELTRITILFIKQSDALQKLFGFLSDLVFAALLHLHWRKYDILQNGLMRKQLIVLEYHTNLLTDLSDIAAVAVDQFAVKTNLAALDRLERIDTSEQGRLAAAGGTDDDDDLALMDVKAQSVENQVIAVGLLYIVNGQNRICHDQLLHFFSRCEASRLIGQHTAKYRTNMTKNNPNAALGDATRFASMI